MAVTADANGTSQMAAILHKVAKPLISQDLALNACIVAKCG